MDDTAVQKLFEMVVGALERNSSALENVASAIKSNGEKNTELASGMRRMTATITGAQRKIGDELGKVIDRGKAAAASLEKEATDVVESRKPKGQSGKV